MQKKYIALCSSPSQGGLELYFLRLVKHFLPQKIVVPVVLEHSFIAGSLSGEAVEIQKVNVLNFFSTAKKLANLAEKHKIGILHISWRQDFYLAVVTKLLCASRLQIVYYRQMQIPCCKKDFIHRFLYSKLSLLLTITKNLEQEALQYLPIEERRVRVLPYGIKAEKPLSASLSREDLYLEHKLNPQIFTLGVFSRIEEHKGQHLVLEAMRMLQTKPMQLLVVGHCDEHNTSYLDTLLETAAKQGLKVAYMPFVDKPQAIMKLVDVVVLATYEETFGLVLAEAMSQEVAVIGSKAGGVPEIIEHEVDGLLFESKNNQSLATEIAKLYDNPSLRTRIAKHGKAKIQKHYSYKSHFEKFAYLLEEYLPTLD